MAMLVMTHWAVNSFRKVYGKTVPVIPLFQPHHPWSTPCPTYRARVSPRDLEGLTPIILGVFPVHPFGESDPRLSPRATERHRFTDVEPESGRGPGIRCVVPPPLSCRAPRHAVRSPRRTPEAMGRARGRGCRGREERWGKCLCSSAHPGGGGAARRSRGDRAPLRPPGGRTCPRRLAERPGRARGDRSRDPVSTAGNSATTVGITVPAVPHPPVAEAPRRTGCARRRRHRAVHRPVGGRPVVAGATAERR